MRFTMDKQTLASALAEVCVVSPRGGEEHLTILRCVCIDAAAEAVTFSATDLEVSVRTRRDADVEATGAVCVIAHDLAAAIKGVRADVVTLDVPSIGYSGQLTIQAGTAVGHLPTLSALDFPSVAFQGVDDDPAAIAPAEHLAALVKRVAFAVGTDEGRPNLTGAFIVVHAGDLRITTRSIVMPMRLGGES